MWTELLPFVKEINCFVKHDTVFFGLGEPAGRATGRVVSKMRHVKSNFFL